MPTQTLHCKIGKHSWEREAKRGRKPENCPDHAPIKISKNPETGEVVVRKRISVPAIVDRVVSERRQRATEPCACPFREEMVWNDLVGLGSGCTGPVYVCPTLDAVRRAIPAEARA